MPSLRDRFWTARYRAKRSLPVQSLLALGVTNAGLRFAHGLDRPGAPPPAVVQDETNPLDEYFDSVTEGPGIVKWRHYFPIYHRHLAKFIGHEVHVVEIGVYSGGSLPMWRSYFGDASRIYGIDIAPECRSHEQEGVEIFIGDQASPTFWEEVLRAVPRIDVVIDDGGHEAHQQIASLHCLLPHMAMGGVYICEDILGSREQFNSFADGISRALSDIGGGDSNPPQPWHEHIASVHRYPQVAVFERPDRPVPSFDSVRHGTIWEPTIEL